MADRIDTSAEALDAIAAEIREDYNKPLNDRSYRIAYVAEHMLRTLAAEKGARAGADRSSLESFCHTQHQCLIEARDALQKAGRQDVVDKLNKIAASYAGPNPITTGVNNAMRAALQASAERFREYERLHAAKPDMEKAKRNAEMAEMCEAALKGDI